MNYKKAYEELLSKITQEHIESLKWIERSGIVTQPVPYGKYCRQLREILETELKYYNTQ